jgi:hypothetical protein
MVLFLLFHTLLPQLLIATTTYAVSLHYHSVNTPALLCALLQQLRSTDVLHVDTVGGMCAICISWYSTTTQCCTSEYVIWILHEGFVEGIKSEPCRTVMQVRMSSKG